MTSATRRSGWTRNSRRITFPLADELARVDGFVRDRSSVRKYCEKHLMPLMRSVFPMERKKPSDEPDPTNPVVPRILAKHEL